VGDDRCCRTGDADDAHRGTRAAVETLRGLVDKNAEAAALEQVRARATVDRCFDPEDEASVVVQLDGVAVSLMFYAQPFRMLLVATRAFMAFLGWSARGSSQAASCSRALPDDGAIARSTPATEDIGVWPLLSSRRLRPSSGTLACGFVQLGFEQDCGDVNNCQDAPLVSHFTPWIIPRLKPRACEL
jgi:hypothetical protein